MADTIGMIFIGIGLFFDFFGCLGLVRLPDVYNRLQASTKCVTFGTCSIMFGVFIMNGVSAIGIKALLIILFLILTSPVSAHALAYRFRMSFNATAKSSLSPRFMDRIVCANS